MSSLASQQDGHLGRQTLGSSPPRGARAVSVVDAGCGGLSSVNCCALSQETFLLTVAVSTDTEIIYSKTTSMFKVS